MAVIETEGLTKRYGSARGIEDVTITVEAGEVFGFLGSNGAGKTTTIRTLLDLLHPTSGSARIFGLDSRRESVAIRARLGNLPGDFGYGKGASGREALSLLARLRGMEGIGRAEALAKRFRANLDRPLGELSRGNRQKVGLILATFHEPELLILDEPTSGLDPLMQEEFLALVGEERERGCAVFISSHELDEVERVCHRVGIVRDGRLIAVERIADLLGKAKRRVRLELAESAGLAELEALAGVSELEVEGRHASFLIGGDLDQTIKAIAGHHVTDIEIAHPTLEEVCDGKSAFGGWQALPWPSFLSSRLGRGSLTIGRRAASTSCDAVKSGVTEKAVSDEDLEPALPMRDRSEGLCRLRPYGVSTDSGCKKVGTPRARPGLGPARQGTGGEADREQGRRLRAEEVDLAGLRPRVGAKST